VGRDDPHVLLLRSGIARRERTPYRTATISTTGTLIGSAWARAAPNESILRRFGAEEHDVGTRQGLRSAPELLGEFEQPLIDRLWILVLWAVAGVDADASDVNAACLGACLRLVAHGAHHPRIALPP